MVLTSAASSANSGIFSTSRMVYGLAHDGAAPSALGKLTKNGVPANALYLTTVMLLFSLVMLYAGSGIMEAFTRGDLRGVDDGYLHLEHDPDCVPGLP